jgi:DoxX-like family
MKLISVFVLANAVTFMFYGASLLISSSMVSDFKRFGLEDFRLLTGSLELLGGIGLVAGLKWPGLMKFAAGGLCLLMLCGVLVRLRSGDSLAQSIPAAALMLSTGYVFAAHLRSA